MVNKMFDAVLDPGPAAWEPIFYTTCPLQDEAGNLYIRNDYIVCLELRHAKIFWPEEKIYVAYYNPKIEVQFYDVTNVSEAFPEVEIRSFKNIETGRTTAAYRVYALDEEPVR